MLLEPLTPQNTTIIAVGFANLLRSHDLADHVNNVVGLAKTATFFRSGLVVTNGLPSKPSGPLYPQLLEVIGDQPVIERPGFFDCFRDEAFAEAVRQTGRRKLVDGHGQAAVCSHPRTAAPAVHRRGALNRGGGTGPARPRTLARTESTVPAQTAATPRPGG
jgi:hypothetical protein